MISRTNLVLGLSLFAVVVMSVVVSNVDYSRPNYEILPDMKYTPAWTTYAANPVFPDGGTLQAPVAGTIARGELPLHFTAGKEDAVRAGEELLNPYEIRDEEAGESADDAAAERQLAAQERLHASVQRGSQAYGVFCVSCHGPQGAGDGPVTQRGFPPPPSLLTGKSMQMQDGQLFHILTYGQGSMAPFAGQLSRERRWDLVNHVREMQQAVPVSAAEEPVDNQL